MTILPEIIFASSDPGESRRIRYLLNDGQIRPLIPRVYTSNLQDPDDNIVRRNVWFILANLFPGAMISHRTAIEYRISSGGNIYLTAGSRRVYRWPGVTIRLAEGPAPLTDDHIYLHDLRVSSLERACLENLSSSRIVEGEKRTVDQKVIEERLLDILHTRGEDALNQLRDRARKIARSFGMDREFEKLNLIIGSILSTSSKSVLTSRRAAAQAVGEPFDSGRIELFTILLAELKQTTFPEYIAKTAAAEAFSHFAFFEAYFSNYIEGTTFLIEEAKDIVYKGVEIPLRLEDTHDIKGTFQIVNDRNEMGRIPTYGEELLALLRARHALIMGGRPDKRPGAFKLNLNRAGDTVFVEPHFLIGTLKQGFELMSSLDDPFARALFMMFLVSEAHPFDDGNGRIARIMMNAELVAAGYTRIIIPTVYREDYMLSLRRLTRHQDPKVYVRTMMRAAGFSHWLDPEEWDTMHQQLERSNAYKEPDQDGTVLNWSEG